MHPGAKPSDDSVQQQLRAVVGYATLLLRQQGDKDALLKALCKDPRNGRLHVLAQRVFLRWGPGLPVERSRPSLLIVLLFGKVTKAFGR